MKTDKRETSASHVIRRIVICIIILSIGVFGMAGLAKMKKPPAEVTYEEPAIKVEVQEASPENIPVFITGFGEVKALDTVSIAPEVPGKVVYIHPRLEVGEIIPKGEILFKIDSRDYLVQYKTNQKRLKTLERNRDLAKAQFERIRSLYEKDNVETQSRVDAMEQSLNSAVDMADTMAQAFALAKTRLERCEIRAPFDGRITMVSVEKGQYVSPGVRAITLANDAVLEIQVPVDSQDARKWLRFNSSQSDQKTAWFHGLEQVPVNIRWTEDPDGHGWEGRLHRVLKFDRQTRTLTLAVKITAQNAMPNSIDSLPLVEGMFCLVEIPGRILTNVVRLPRWAVSFDNTVYISNNGRLKTRPVTVERVEGEDAYISEGLNPGTTVVTTRLIDPLENTRLTINNPDVTQ